MKIILFIATLVCLLFPGTGHAQIEKRFGSIIVRSRMFDGPPRNGLLIDYDCTFAWMVSDFWKPGMPNAAVCVYSKPVGRWLQIEKVSTVGAKFGKSPQFGKSSLPLPQQPWDFTGFASKDFVPLPLWGLGPHIPDKVTFDEARKAYVLHFDSGWKDESVRTTILVPKKDLTEAFDYYSHWFSGGPQHASLTSLPASLEQWIKP